MTDIARYGFETPGESTQGAGAIALLVERDPKFLRLTLLSMVYSLKMYSIFGVQPAIMCQSLTDNILLNVI